MVLKTVCRIGVLLLLLIPETMFAQMIGNPWQRARLDRGIEQNERRQYMDAYKTLADLNDSLEVAMRMAGKTSAQLSFDEIRTFYWPLKKSLAETAYMFGLQSVMTSISKEMEVLIETLNGDGPDPNVKQWRAEKAKIDAAIYFLNGDFPKAEKELLWALASSSRYEYGFVDAVHEELAQLYYRTGRYEKALAEIDSIGKNIPPRQFASVDKQWKRNENTSQRALCMARIGNYVEAIKIIDTVVGIYSKSKDRRAYAESLRKKGKILIMQYDSTGVYNDISIKCYEQYMRESIVWLNKHFAEMSESEREQYWMAEHPFITDCFRLEDKAPELLFNVALFSKALLLQMGRKLNSGMIPEQRQRVLETLKVSWRDVQNKLPDSAVAIEFIVYEKKNDKHIGALVLGKRFPGPKFVYIAPLSVIVDHDIDERNTVNDCLNTVNDKNLINNLYQNDSLRRLIWNEGLVETIGDSRTIYFAPDGLFYRIGIEYMVPPVMEKKQFFRLTTTRLLVETRQEIRRDSLLLIGGINYKTENGSSGGVDNDKLAYDLIASKRVSLPHLDYSGFEVGQVKALRGRVADFLLYADSATEAVVRNLLGKYHMALFSTHGYIEEAQKIGTEIRPASTDVQLSHSCLFLSGAEKNINDTAFGRTAYDGILSAREIAGMDLSNVDLAVLSACMSGLGYVTPDGVFGLQRGMKTAGVKAIIVSLWSVDDESTSILMSALYSNLEKGMLLHDAFSMARQELKETVFHKRIPPRDIPGAFDEPYYYDAFILIDGIE